MTSLSFALSKLPSTMIVSQPQPQSSASEGGLASLFDMILEGGPLMVPIGLCSVVALAYIVERSIRLRGPRLGTMAFGRRVVLAAEEGGAERAIQICEEKPRLPLSRILVAGLERARGPFMEMEKAVEDAGAREVKRLSANLRPLVVVGMIAPLLGLLGTVWGMIQAFQTISTGDGLGRPERLAEGISEALITTAAGLTIAIPAQAAYYFFRSRIDRFVRHTEDTYASMTSVLRRGA